MLLEGGIFILSILTGKYLWEKIKKSPEKDIHNYVFRFAFGKHPQTTYEKYGELKLDTIQYNLIEEQLTAIAQSEKSAGILRARGIEGISVLKNGEEIFYIWLVMA